MFYWLLKWVFVGPLLKMVFRPHAEGADHVPDEGAAILASNHLSYADWLFMPLTLTRRVTFVAKAEYFTTPGLKGWFQKKFFSGAGQVPIDRSGASAAEGALNSAKKILGAGGLFSLDGVHPTTVTYGLIAQEMINVMRLASVRFLHGQGALRTDPVIVDFERLILRDTLIRRPPQNLAPALDILGWADDALDWTKRALSR